MKPQPSKVQPKVALAESPPIPQANGVDHWIPVEVDVTQAEGPKPWVKQYPMHKCENPLCGILFPQKRKWQRFHSEECQQAVRQLLFVKISRDEYDRLLAIEASVKSRPVKRKV